MHIEQFKKNQTGTHYNLYNGNNKEMYKLKLMRGNICHYANIIDDFAPCIVLSKVWNDDVKMNLYATPLTRSCGPRKSCLLVMRHSWY